MWALPRHHPPQGHAGCRRCPGRGAPAGRSVPHQGFGEIGMSLPLRRSSRRCARTTASGSASSRWSTPPTLNARRRGHQRPERRVVRPALFVAREPLVQRVPETHVHRGLNLPSHSIGLTPSADVVDDDDPGDAPAVRSMNASWAAQLKAEWMFGCFKPTLCEFVQSTRCVVGRHPPDRVLDDQRGGHLDADPPAPRPMRTQLTHRSTRSLGRTAGRLPTRPAEPHVAVPELPVDDLANGLVPEHCRIELDDHLQFVFVDQVRGDRLGLARRAAVERRQRHRARDDGGDVDVGVEPPQGRTAGGRWSAWRLACRG